MLPSEKRIVSFTCPPIVARLRFHAPGANGWLRLNTLPSMSPRTLNVPIDGTERVVFVKSRMTLNRLMLPPTAKRQLAMELALIDETPPAMVHLPPVMS